MTATHWELDDDRDGVVVHISDAGRAALADEQAQNATAKMRAEIRIWCVGAGIVAIVCLMAKHLLGV